MHTATKTSLSAHHQRGAVLVVAMLLLIAITVLSTTAVSVGIMEKRTRTRSRPRWARSTSCWQTSRICPRSAR
jgi:Tfp pilus assembly protein PilX